MRNILVLCCAFLFPFCVAIPFVFPANFGNLASPHVHMETPHIAVGSLQDVNSGAYDGQDKRAMLHDATGCFFSTNTQDGGEDNAGLGHEMHNVASRCVNTRSNVRLSSRGHDGSVRKVLATGTSSKPTVANADGPHWFHLADYRRSPMLGFLQEIEQPTLTSTSTERPYVEPTPTPATHTKKLKEKPAHSQGSEDSRPDGWPYQDWKQ